jgi:hypothetical protein
MAHRISVTEELDSFGQQVFVFGLPNGRTLKLDFCAHLIDPGGDACCVVARLFDENGERVELLVNESGKERESLSAPCLWFSTHEENQRHGEMVTQELNAIKEELAPLMEAEEGRDKYKNN